MMPTSQDQGLRICIDGRDDDPIVTCCGRPLQEHSSGEGWSCEACNTLYDRMEVVAFVRAAIGRLGDIATVFGEPHELHPDAR